MTVQHGTGSCPGHRGVEQECLAAYGITFCPVFSCIIGNLASAVPQVIAQCLLVIEDIVHCFFQLASSRRRKDVLPLKESLSDRCFKLYASRFSPLCWKPFEFYFDKKHPVAVGQSNLRRDYLRDILSHRKYRFFYGFLRVDIKKLPFFPTPCRYHFIKLSPAVGKAADEHHIFHLVVALVSIALQQSGETLQEILRILSSSAGLVIIII